MNEEIQSIFTEFTKRRAEIEVSIPQMKQDLAQFLDKIVLYGAGSAGIAFLHYLQDVGIFPRYFVDGDPKKWGSVVEGVQVIAPDEVVKRVSDEALVIVTINTDGKRYCKSFTEALRRGGHPGVHHRLLEAGCKHTIDYTFFRRCHALFRNDPYNLPSCSDVQLMLEHQEDISDAYTLLSDAESRDIFKKILRFRLLDDSIEIPTLPQDNQYFEYDIYQSIEHEIFVDCGAFNGITLKKFLENNENRFDGYFVVEPDEENYRILKGYIAGLPKEIQSRVTLYSCAVADVQGNASLYALEGPGSFIADDIGTRTVSTDTIDHILQGGPATMIKMNIEGSEIRALMGAKQTIMSYHPVLAVAGYHKTWDLWDIPKKINVYEPQYRVYLRSYMNHISFVYYFVPEERCHG